MVNLFLIQNLLSQKLIFKLNITFHALKHNSLLNKNKNISKRALKKMKINPYASYFLRTIKPNYPSVTE